MGKKLLVVELAQINMKKTQDFFIYFPQSKTIKLLLKSRDTYHLNPYTRPSQTNATSLQNAR